MSHFTVAVIANNITEMEDMLAPYQENNMGDCPREYLEFNSITEEYRDTYENGTTYKDGKQISYKELYPTFDKYMEEFWDREKDEEMNDYGYWENPNRKWDWYSIGGRWRNSLLTRADNEDVISETGFEDLMNGGHNLKKAAPEGYKWVDGARIKDIDFKKKMEFQDTYNKAIRFWELYVEGQEPQTEEEKEEIKMCWRSKEYFEERYGTKENYAKMESTYYTWALLDEDGWHEQGHMGFWCVNDSTKDSEMLFAEKFTEIINKPENQDKYLIIVDCHI